MTEICDDIRAVEAALFAAEDPLALEDCHGRLARMSMFAPPCPHSRITMLVGA